MDVSAARQAREVNVSTTALRAPRVTAPTISRSLQTGDIEGSQPAILKFAPRGQRIAADPYPWRNAAPRTQGRLAGLGSGQHPYGLTAVEPSAVLVSRRTYFRDHYMTTSYCRPVVGTPSGSLSPVRSPARATSTLKCDDIAGASPRLHWQRLADKRTRSTSPVTPQRASAQTAVASHSTESPARTVATPRRELNARHVPSWWWG